MTRRTVWGIAVRTSAVAWLAWAVGCSGNDHGHDHADDHGHEHADDHADHADDHGHAHEGDEHAHEGDEHADEGGGHDDHGHGAHDGASEVITRWGERTQLFVEFPALVVGEDSPFAAHLTRLQDHFAIDAGHVTVELSGGSAASERFEVAAPSVAGIFRPVVRPAHAGTRRVTLTLQSAAASESHDLGELTVFATRAEADAAAPEEAESPDEISYLLEQQWKVPFRVQAVRTMPIRPSVSAFARLVLPPDAASEVTAPRAGRVVAIGGRLPFVGETLDAGAPLFALSSSPGDGTLDTASLDLEVEQATIRVASAQREVDRLGPLVTQGVVAQRRLDEATSALAGAQAELRSARRRRGSFGQAQRVRGGADGLTIPSPIAGTLAELFVAPGAWVSSGDRLARVVDQDRLWLDVAVPEAYVGRLRRVSGAWFTLGETHLEVSREALVSIGTEIADDSRTLPVRFRIDNVRRELFAGATTEAHLIVDEPRVTTAVPYDALVEDAGADVVFVQLGGETFERRVVRLGERDGEWIEVLGGVTPDEWVVTRGAHSVKLAASSTAALGHGHAH